MSVDPQEKTLGGPRSESEQHKEALGWGVRCGTHLHRGEGVRFLSHGHRRSQERLGLSREVHHAGTLGEGRTGRELVREQPQGTVCSMSLGSDLPITMHVLAYLDVTKSQ